MSGFYMPNYTNPGIPNGKQAVDISHYLLLIVRYLFTLCRQLHYRLRFIHDSATKNVLYTLRLCFTCARNNVQNSFCGATMEKEPQMLSVIVFLNSAGHFFSPKSLKVVQCDSFELNNAGEKFSKKKTSN